MDSPLPLSEAELAQWVHDWSEPCDEENCMDNCAAIERLLATIDALRADLRLCAAENSGYEKQIGALSDEVIRLRSDLTAAQAETVEWQARALTQAAKRIESAERLEKAEAEVAALNLTMSFIGSVTLTIARQQAAKEVERRAVLAGGTGMTQEMTDEERERVVRILQQMRRNLAADALADAVEELRGEYPEDQGDDWAEVYTTRALFDAVFDTLTAYREAQKSPGD